MAPVLIAQHDVFANPGGPSDYVPFVVVMQADALHHTSSVVVAPLVTGNIVSNSRLTFLFRVAGQDCALMVTDIAAIPRRLLREPIASLASQRDRISAALDLLFFGF